MAAEDLHFHCSFALISSIDHWHCLQEIEHVKGSDDRKGAWHVASFLSVRRFSSTEWSHCRVVSMLDSTFYNWFIHPFAASETSNKYQCKGRACSTSYDGLMSPFRGGGSPGSGWGPGVGAGRCRRESNIHSSSFLLWPNEWARTHTRHIYILHGWPTSEFIAGGYPKQGGRASHNGRNNEGNDDNEHMTPAAALGT